MPWGVSLVTDGVRPRRVRMAVSQKLERLVDRSIGRRTEALREEVERLAAMVSQLGETVSELRSMTSESHHAISEEVVRLGARITEVRRIAAASLDDIP